MKRRLPSTDPPQVGVRSISPFRVDADHDE
jgi:hypothetical protein